VEYALIILLVAIVVIYAAILLDDRAGNMFKSIPGSL